MRPGIASVKNEAPACWSVRQSLLMGLLDLRIDAKVFLVLKTPVRCSQRRQIDY